MSPGEPLAARAGVYNLSLSVSGIDGCTDGWVTRVIKIIKVIMVIRIIGVLQGIRVIEIFRVLGIIGVIQALYSRVFAVLP